MLWLDKLERRFGRYYIPRLPLVVVAGQAIFWLLIMLVDSRIYSLMTLTRAGLLHGQVWRVVSFLFIPSLQTNPLWLVLELYLLYMIGTSLENAWGGFRLNVYYLVGLLGAVLAALLGGSASNAALNLSLFFAFACLYPETQFLLFFVIPVKVKWLGWAAAAYYVYCFLVGGWSTKLGYLLGLANFLLFFGPTLWQQLQNIRRRQQWKNQWKQ